LACVRVGTAGCGSGEGGGRGVDGGDEFLSTVSEDCGARSVVAGSALGSGSGQLVQGDDATSIG
jgi:hypothetical protein